MATHDRPRLVLWDIDYTLLESRGLGRMMYQRAFPEVTGRPLEEFAVAHGRTELDIMHETLRLHGIAPSEDVLERLAGAVAEAFREAVDELVGRGRVLPGVWQTLEGLAVAAGVHQGVLTGNSAEVARIKLAAFGLQEYLDPAVGAFGDDDRDRAALVPIACERASRVLGTAIVPADAVLIGDTPHDVSAAREAGAYAVAVASGVYSADELRAAGAAVTLSSLRDVSHPRDVLPARVSQQ